MLQLMPAQETNCHKVDFNLINMYYSSVERETKHITTKCIYNPSSLGFFKSIWTGRRQQRHKLQKQSRWNLRVSYHVPGTVPRTSRHQSVWALTKKGFLVSIYKF